MKRMRWLGGLCMGLALASSAQGQFNLFIPSSQSNEPPTVAGAADPGSPVIQQVESEPPADSQGILPEQASSPPEISGDKGQGPDTSPVLGGEPCYQGFESCPAPCCPAEPRAWFGAEYLLWWMSGPNVPPLVTTSPPGTPFGTAGVLDDPVTTILFGGGEMDQEAFSGLRLSAGSWLGAGNAGFEVNGFLLEQRTVVFNAASDANGAPTLARPFFDPNIPVQSASLVAFPGPPVSILSGNMNIGITSQLWGTEANFLFNPGAGSNSVVWLAGFRYLDLDEELNIEQNSNLQPGSALVFNGNTLVLFPGSVRITDAFHTRNQFYGGQLGFKGQRTFGDWTLGLTGKVGLGSTHQVVNIHGTSELIQGGAVTQTAQGGLLALSTNIGRQDRDVFTVVPEVEVKLGYNVTRQVQAFVGYNFLYWSEVVRPGDQIDPTVNITNVPTSFAFGLDVGPDNPAPEYRDTDFWTQGINFGLMFSF